MKVNNKIFHRITPVCAAVVVFVSCMFLPVSVFAVEYNDFNLSANCRLYNTAFGVDHINETVNITNNSSFSYTWEAEAVGLNYGTSLSFSLELTGTNNSILVRKDVPFNFYIDNLCLFFEFYNSTGDYSFYWNNPNSNYRITLRYSDGSTEVFTNVQSNFYNFAQYISAYITPSKDVSSIQFYQDIRMIDLTDLPMNSVWDSIYVFGLPRENFNVSIDTDSKESGLLGDLNNQLGDAINGTPQQNQQVDDAIGGLTGKTDDLDALGDQMSSVDKPTIDSNKISADSLVPHTALVALSSPFQALWENNQLLAILTIVVTLVLVSWVFFGKKG